MASASFLEAEQWTCRYQRNNKRSGLKNLRCFPLCSDAHRLRGFCGRPAFVRVANPGRREVACWASFVKLPGDDGSALAPGAEMSDEQVDELVRSKADPFKPWIVGEAREDGAAARFRNEPELDFVFNKGRKGWHYSWVANKHTCDSEHVLRAYVFERVPGPTPKCRLVTWVDSPPFTIFCRRRQRQNLDRLPAQLKAQLELQDAIKSGGATSGAMPRSISVAAAPVSQQQTRAKRKKAAPTVKRTSKRTKTEVSTQGAAEAEAAAEMAAMAAMAPPPERQTTQQQQQQQTKPEVPETSYEEKTHLLFHIMRSLLRLDVKSAKPLLNNVASSDIHIAGDRAEHEGGDFEDISKSISDCLDCFTLPAGGSSPEGEDAAESLSLPDLDDFKPFDIDFSALDVSELSQLDAAGGGGGGSIRPSSKLTFGEIMKEFANFLIEEDYFTSTIEAALSSVSGDCPPSTCRAVAVAVLLDLLKTFLESYNITLDELYHLFKTQVWTNNPGPPLASNARNAAPPAQTSIIKVEHDADPAEQKEAETSFTESVTHYTKTVRVSQSSPRGSPHSSDSASTYAFSQIVPTASPAAGTPKSTSATMPPPPPPPPPSQLPSAAQADPSSSSSSAASSSALAPSADDSCSTDSGPSSATCAPYVPEGDPRNDLSGEWMRPQETLDVLEGIRESIGVPWVLRKMLRHMEADLRIVHVEGAIEAQSNRKLLSSGFQRYVLDGKEHQWQLPPPIPTERPQRGATYQATLENGLLCLKLCYSSRKRIVRETRKSADGNRLESVVRFQFRASKEAKWEDKLTASAVALRKAAPREPPSPAPGAMLEDEHDDAMEAELSWLSVPCDDFSLSLA